MMDKDRNEGHAVEERLNHKNNNKKRKKRKGTKR